MFYVVNKNVFMKNVISVSTFFFFLLLTYLQEIELNQLRNKTKSNYLTNERILEQDYSNKLTFQNPNY